MHFIGYRKQSDYALYFRKEMEISKPFIRVSMDVSALGLVKPFCNGEALGSDLLTPGWTNYHVRIPYYTFELTENMREGKNAVGFCVGNGWAIGKVAWFGKKLYGDRPLLWCRILIEYTDGTQEIIGSDETFLVSFGKVRENDVYDGETQDARLCLGDFSSPEYDSTAWEKATEYEGYSDRLEKASVALTKKHERFEGNYLYDRNGYAVYDFGQNHAGVPEILIKEADNGTKLTFIFGEMLDEDGSVYTGNLRTILAADTYICREGAQEFCPEMTFHGYRYMGIKTEGFCKLGRIYSRMVYSDIPFYGSFECSDADINQLYSNIISSQKSNFINVPTDCPQRDERLGWTGDAQVFCLSAMYNADCNGFFRKYLKDVRDAQQENGMIDSVAPTVAVDFDHVEGSAAWGDVITVLPYQHYCVYGDKSIIEENLPAAKRWIRYCVENSEHYIRKPVGYGDWLSMGEVTDKSFLGAVYIAYSALLTAKMCRIIEDPETDIYQRLYEDVRSTIREQFITNSGKLKDDTQTAYVLAYTFGLMSGEEIHPHLLECIRRQNNHLSTGFVGVKYLLPTLCGLGEYDLAFEIFTKKDYPSWCYPVVNGATTIWERWDSYVRGRGFHESGMNSFNHYSFGAVCEWMFSMVLGIIYEEDRIRIKPVIDQSGKITCAKGRTLTGEGYVSVEWENLEDGRTLLMIEKNDKIQVDLSEYTYVEEADKNTYYIKR